MELVGVVQRWEDRCDFFCAAQVLFVNSKRGLLIVLSRPGPCICRCLRSSSGGHKQVFWLALLLLEW
jgi:hypothetical protein